MATKKVKASGRFKVGYGINSRKRLNKVEEKQRKKQVCPFCKKEKAKRVSRGIWECEKCGKKFASNVFYLEE